MAKSPGSRGRPPFEPTDAQRAVVRALRANGVDHETIATYLGIHERTLYKYFREEMDRGIALFTAEVGLKLADKIRAGDTTAIIFWLKARARWRTVDRDDDAPPAPTGAADELSDADLASIAQRGG